MYTSSNSYFWRRSPPSNSLIHKSNPSFEQSSTRVTYKKWDEDNSDCNVQSISNGQDLEMSGQAPEADFKLQWDLKRLKIQDKSANSETQLRRDEIKNQRSRLLVSQSQQMKALEEEYLRKKQKQQLASAKLQSKTLRMKQATAEAFSDELSCKSLLFEEFGSKNKSCLALNEQKCLSEETQQGNKTWNQQNELILSLLVVLGTLGPSIVESLLPFNAEESLKHLQRNFSRLLDELNHRATKYYENPLLLYLEDSSVVKDLFTQLLRTNPPCRNKRNGVEGSSFQYAWKPVLSYLSWKELNCEQ